VDIYNLIRLITKEELEEVIFSMNLNISQGLDGFTAYIFHKS
jgi:hypothetical protein